MYQRQRPEFPGPSASVLLPSIRPEDTRKQLASTSEFQIRNNDDNLLQAMNRRLTTTERGLKVVLEETARLQAELKEERERRTTVENELVSHKKKISQLQNTVIELDELNGLWTILVDEMRQTFPAEELEVMGFKDVDTLPPVLRVSSWVISILGTLFREHSRSGGKAGLAVRVQQLEHSVEALSDSESMKMQEHSDEIRKLVAETGILKSNMKDMDDFVRHLTVSAQQQAEQIEAELRTAGESVGRLQSHMEKIKEETVTNVEQLTQKVAQQSEHLEQTRRRSVHSTNFENKVGEVTDKYAEAIEQLAADVDQLTSQIESQEGTMQRMQESLQKQEQKQNGKMVESEKRVVSTISQRLEHAFKLIKEESQERSKLQKKLSHNEKEQKTLISHELNASREMIQQSAEQLTSLVSGELNLSMKKMHESMQIAERSAEMQKKELSTVLDAEIRQRKEQFNHYHKSLAMMSKDVAGCNNSLEKVKDEIGAALQKFSVEAQRIARQEVSEVSSNMNNSFQDVDNRLSALVSRMVTLQEQSNKVSTDMEGQLDVQREQAQTVFSAMYERIGTQYKALEARVEALPSQLSNMNEKMLRTRQDLVNRMQSEVQDRQREIESLQLALSRKVDTDRLGQAEKVIRDRISRTEESTATLKLKLAEVSGTLEGTKTLLAASQYNNGNNINNNYNQNNGNFGNEVNQRNTVPTYPPTPTKLPAVERNKNSVDTKMNPTQDPPEPIVPEDKDKIIQTKDVDTRTLSSHASSPSPAENGNVSIHDSENPVDQQRNSPDTISQTSASPQAGIKMNDFMSVLAQRSGDPIDGSSAKTTTAWRANTAETSTTSTFEYDDINIQNDDNDDSSSSDEDDYATVFKRAAKSPIDDRKPRHSSQEDFLTSQESLNLGM
eukprot:m.28484 g.28484  ORF g.28484 m.28484 type:complete len:897 (-) comp8004_c0_seq1:106-2796(-)